LFSTCRPATRIRGHGAGSVCAKPQGQAIVAATGLSPDRAGDDRHPNALMPEAYQASAATPSV
jgi:hypothetical protein